MKVSDSDDQYEDMIKMANEMTRVNKKLLLEKN